MRYPIFATDYDGTLAHHGAVDDATIAALLQLRESGRQTIMVTGREVEDLQTVFSRLDLFDLVVAENGALLYHPKTGKFEPLHAAPPEPFVRSLRKRGVSPLSVGHVIVATVEPYDTVILQVIKEHNLDLQIIFNKGAVMVLPSGVNKATGLAAALLQLNALPENVIGVGDAENDHAFLDFCGCGVAVSNALPALKEHVDVVTSRPHGEGVIELINRLVDTNPTIPLPKPRTISKSGNAPSFSKQPDQHILAKSE